MKLQLDKINMLNDCLFKALFRSIEAREMVATFISHVTGINEELIRNAEYQGGELTKKNIHEKGKISDIIIKIGNKNQIIVEMNQYPSKYIFEKNTSYAFAIASELTQVGSKKYPNVYLINLDNFNKFKTKEGILYFKMRDEQGHIEIENYQSIHIILENIISENYNEDIEIKKTIKLLKKQKLTDMKNEYEGDEKYMAAVRKVEELSMDPNFVGYYDKEEAIKQDLEDMRITGYEEGEKKGKIESKKDIIKKMLAKNFDINTISEITELSIEEIKKLN